jgi:hypothetical protein
MFEYRAVWSVTGGGVGYSVFHVREGVTPSVATAAQGFADDLRAGLATLTGDLPNDVSISFESEARELDVSTGTLVGVHAVDPPSDVAGIGTGVYAAPSGAKVDLNTEGIVAGRRLTGRTFIVPLIGTAYTDGGLIASGTRSRLNTAFEAFRDEVDLYSLAVWSRTHGILADVTSVSASLKAAVLRSRRD